MAKMTRIMISRFQWNLVGGRYEAKLNEKLADVFDFEGELAKSHSQFGVSEYVGIVFQHGAAAGGIRDNCIRFRRRAKSKSCEVLRGEMQGPRGIGPMVIQRAAATLHAWNPHL